jgi:ATP-dependent RNA helicase DOB1
VSAGAPPAPATPGDPAAELHVVPVPLALVEAVGALRVGLPADLRAPATRAAALATLTHLERRYEGKGQPTAGSIPLLDPVVDAGVDDPAVVAAAGRLREVEAELAAEAQADPAVAAALADPSLAAAGATAAALSARAAALTTAMRDSQLSLYRAEARRRLGVLRDLGHVEAIHGGGGHGGDAAALSAVLTLKGRAACEIDAADELLASELMFNGVFGGLDPPRLAALASCLVPVEKSAAPVELASALATPLADLQAAARRIAAAQVNARIPDAPAVDDYVASFAPTLMDAVYSWARGASFQQAVDRTDLFEGSLIRAVRRLDELLAQLGAAARVVGDDMLAGAFSAASGCIRRDIVFAASLYV